MDELCEFLGEHFKTGSQPSYGLVISGVLRSKPDLKISLNNWEDCFELAQFVGSFDKSRPFRVQDTSLVHTLSVLKLNWVSSNKNHNNKDILN